MTLNERLLEDDPLGALLNGMPYDAPATEFPMLGTTEMWEIVNMTGDTHPIHIHLVQFQLLNRQKINAHRYESAFTAANPVLPATSARPVDRRRIRASFDLGILTSVAGRTPTKEPGRGDRTAVRAPGRVAGFTA
jgi:FtsP/CotA-like multicopper oxidase with cupredoxin domain